MDDDGRRLEEAIEKRLKELDTEKLRIVYYFVHALKTQKEG